MMRNPDPRLTRRSFLQCGAAAAGGLALSRAAAPAAASGPADRPSPNIVLIVCDQMSIDAMSACRDYFAGEAWLAHWVSTPNLDRLASGGAMFLNSHSAYPVCSPARSSLFTGRFPTETGMTTNNLGIDKRVPNMGQWLESHTDYDRVYCGKWHAGGKWNYPTVAGPRKIPGFETLPVGAGATGDVQDYGVSGAVSAYILNHGKDAPFLIVAGFMSPHDICFLFGGTAFPNEDDLGLGAALPPLPPNFLSGPSDGQFRNGARNKPELVWRNCIHAYLRMVEKLDADVGRVLRAVEARNDNTLIIFTADHGEGAGRHGRNGKGTPWDWALKVPLIVWGPNLGVRHRVDLASLASGVDIMATVCDYAGAPPPPRCQGMSLRPLLEGAKAPWRQALYAETAMTACHILRDERFKLAMMYRYSGSYDQPFLLAEGEKTQFLPAAPDRLAKDDPLSWMLYDMKEDPWEMRNLAADPAYRGVLETMLAQLAEEHESRLIPGQRFDRN